MTTSYIIREDGLVQDRCTGLQFGYVRKAPLPYLAGMRVRFIIRWEARLPWQREVENSLSLPAFPTRREAAEYLAGMAPEDEVIG